MGTGAGEETDATSSTGRWLALVLLVMAAIWVVLFLFTTAGWSAPGPELAEFCRREYDACAAEATRVADSLHCRIELRHCRAGQPFERLDGTMVDVPVGDP